MSRKALITAFFLFLTKRPPEAVVRILFFKLFDSELITGILSDILSKNYGKESLRYSLMILTTLKLWSAYHYYLAGKYLKYDLVTD